MKKTIIGLLIALVVVYLVFVIIGSDKEHAAEKMLYKTSKLQLEIMANPDVAPPSMVSEVKNGLETIVSKYPDTRVAKAAYMKLIEMQLLNKNYDTVIEMLDGILEKDDTSLSSRANAHFFKAVAYQKMDRWNDALAQFNILKEKYVSTPIGIQAPMYIARYYRGKGDKEKAREEFSKAVIFYQELRTNYKGMLAGYTASNLQAQAYMHLGMVEEAGEVVTESIIDYPSTMTYSHQLPLIDAIYIRALKQPKKAINLYRIIIENTDDVELEEFLHDKIRGALTEE